MQRENTQTAAWLRVLFHVYIIIAFLILFFVIIWRNARVWLRMERIKHYCLPTRKRLPSFTILLGSKTVKSGGCLLYGFWFVCVCMWLCTPLKVCFNTAKKTDCVRNFYTRNLAIERERTHTVLLFRHVRLWLINNKQQKEYKAS